MSAAAQDAIAKLKAAGFGVEEIALRVGASRAQISNVARGLYPAKADLERRLIRAANAMPAGGPLVDVRNLIDG